MGGWRGSSARDSVQAAEDWLAVATDVRFIAGPAGHRSARDRTGGREPAYLSDHVRPTAAHTGHSSPSAAWGPRDQRARDDSPRDNTRGMPRRIQSRTSAGWNLLPL